MALPEIYYRINAKQWHKVAENWDQADDNCPEYPQRSCYFFAGATSEPKSCPTNLSPGSSWNQLKKANRGRTVRRELIYWNPRRMSLGMTHGDMGLSRPSLRVIAGVAACVVAGGAVVAILATSGPDSSPPSQGTAANGAGGTQQAPPSASQPVSSGGSTQGEGDSGKRENKPHYIPLPHLQPGKIIADPNPLVSSEVMSVITNGWHVGNHWGYTLVNAGQATGERSKGLFAISRYRVRNDSQKLDLVNVAGAGPVKITRAPVGPSVVKWAQDRGNIRFTSKSGITGTFHLKDDTVTLNP